MATKLGDILPTPTNTPIGGELVPLTWLSWFDQLYRAVKGAVISFVDLDFTGSNITSIATRLFTDLQFTGSNITSIATRLFTDLQFAGSNLTSIATRNHDDLQNISGSGTIHLSTTEIDRINSNRVLTWLSM